MTIVGVDNLRSGEWKRAPREVERIEVDITSLSLADWRELCSGVSTVFHLAAEKYNSSKSTPEKLLLSNVIATERLARAAALERVGRFVFTSSLYAYGSLGPSTMVESDVPLPVTLYGASKIMGEHILRSIDRELGLSWNVARLFFIYGPKQFAEGGYKSVVVANFERLLRQEPAIIFGDGEQTLDYVFVDDCVKGLRLLGESNVDRKIVNISSGQAISVNNLTALMTSIVGRPNSVTRGLSDWTAGTKREGDPTLAFSLFGWKASTSLETGLAATFNWMTR